MYNHKRNRAPERNIVPKKELEHRRAREAKLPKERQTKGINMLSMQVGANRIVGNKKKEGETSGRRKTGIS